MADKISARYARDRQVPESAREPFEQVGGLYKNQLVAAHLHSNYAHQDPNDFPKGAAIVFSGDARLHAAPFNERMCGHVMVVRVRDREDMDDEYFRQRLSQLQQAVPQHGGPGPTLSNRDPDTNRDVAEWQAQLGDHGHFVGNTKPYQFWIEKDKQ